MRRRGRSRSTTVTCTRWCTRTTAGLSTAAPVNRTGLPLRPEILRPELAAEHEELGLQKGRLTFLVFGGSQGAHRLNELVVESLSALLPMKEKIQFVHISGAKDYDFVASAYRTWGYVSHVAAFSRDMGRLYALSDMIIGRAGASSVMEIAAVQKPALLIPFPYATDNHQELNARYLSDRGAALLELEKDLTVQRFQSILVDIIQQPDRLDSYRRELSGIAEDPGGAARRFADFLEETARSKPSITRGKGTP